jgi:hypothetical protein
VQKIFLFLIVELGGKSFQGLMNFFHFGSFFSIFTNLVFSSTSKVELRLVDKYKAQNQNSTSLDSLTFNCAFYVKKAQFMESYLQIVNRQQKKGVDAKLLMLKVNDSNPHIAPQLLEIGPIKLLKKFHNDNDYWAFVIFWYSLSFEDMLPIPFHSHPNSQNIWSFIKSLGDVSMREMGEDVIRSFKKYILKHCSLLEKIEDKIELLKAAEDLYASKFYPLIYFIALNQSTPYLKYLKKLDMNQSIAFWHLMVHSSPYALFKRELNKFKIFRRAPNPPFRNPLIYLVHYIYADRSNLHGLPWIADQDPEVVVYFFWFGGWDMFGEDSNGRLEKPKEMKEFAHKTYLNFKKTMESNSLNEMMSKDLREDYLRKIEALIDLYIPLD